MRKIKTTQEAEVLLEKYYDGFTSVEEEKLLHTFLSQKNLSGQFEADKILLGYFASHKKKSKIQILPLLRWASVAASVIVVITTVYLLMSDKLDSYAYIDGKKITNMEQIKEQAFTSLLSWNDSNNDSDLDMDELIIQQLQLFTK